jgi:hypothetical protein
MTDPWTKKYEKMITDVAQNEAEEAALRMLNQGASLIEAEKKSGLSYEQFRDLMDRANRYEGEVICNGKLRSDTQK